MMMSSPELAGRPVVVVGASVLDVVVVLVVVDAIVVGTPVVVDTPGVVGVVGVDVLGGEGAIVVGGVTTRGTEVELTIVGVPGPVVAGLPGIGMP